MGSLTKIYTLKDEALVQLYIWIDKEVRPLLKKADGTIDQYGAGLIDNDIDALRHPFFQVFILLSLVLKRQNY